MNLASTAAACGMLALCGAALAPAPASAQDRHYYVCSGLASADRTFVVSSVFAAPAGAAARLNAAFLRYLLGLNPPYRVDESSVQCLGDASLSLASYRLIRLRNENSLYRIAEVGFAP